MNAKAVAATVAGLGLLVIGGGGSLLVVIAWVLGTMELSVTYWLLPLAAVLGVAIASYGLVRLASDLLGDASSLRDLLQNLNLRHLRHLMD